MFVNGSYTPVLPTLFGEGPSYGRACVSRDPSGQITLSTGPGNDAISVARGPGGLYHVTARGDQSSQVSISAYFAERLVPAVFLRQNSVVTHCL